MKNIDFLKKILMSEAEYWLVAKEVTARQHLRDVRQKDHILFISIPKGIKRGLKYEEITLQELEKLNGSFCEQNIYINTEYPPFQRHISFYNIYDGFPVTHNIKQFLLNALVLGSSEIREFKELIQLPDINNTSQIG